MPPPYKALEKSGDREGLRTDSRGDPVRVRVLSTGEMLEVFGGHPVGRPKIDVPGRTFSYLGETLAFDADHGSFSQAWANGEPMPFLVKYEDSDRYQWEWRLEDGRLHRDDGPALIRSDGTSEWYRYGDLHRADGPARANDYYLFGMKVEERVFLARYRALGKIKVDSASLAWSAMDSASRKWEAYVEYSLHRVHGPALRWKGKDLIVEEWFAGGKPHRAKKPAVKWTYKGSTLLERHYTDGRLHHDKDPAVWHPKIVEYYENGLRSRYSGPSVIRGGAREWWFKGIRMSATVYQNTVPTKVETCSGTRYFLGDGEHRVDGPSWKCAKTGSERWVQHGKFHRDDGPAIHTKDRLGDTIFAAWYRYGVLHREGGGPAKVDTDRRLEEWYHQGRLHRLDGPALVDDMNRHYVWAKNGEFHRENGPAVIQGEREEWWIRGLRHREGRPAIEDCGLKAWYEFGVLHRKDGPAYEDAFRKEWRHQGKLHREDGPAIERADGLMEYYQNDLRHRVGGPAVIHPDGDEEYWERGVRLPSPKRSVRGAKGKELIRYTLNKKLHRLGGPAVIDEAKDMLEYWVNGQRHREDGPAVATPNVREYWVNGQLHRLGDAARIDTKLGVVEYWYKGMKHREDGPAVVYDDGREEWWYHGMLHRFDGPAICDRQEQAWYVFGELHRDEGPARITDLPDMDVLEEWYLGGVQYPSKEEHAKHRSFMTDQNGEKVWTRDGRIYRKWAPALISQLRWEWREDPEVDGPSRNEGPSQIFASPEGFRDPFAEVWAHGSSGPHREDGPAVVRADGSQEWRIQGVLHREDGPARVADGSVSFFIHGTEVSEREYYTKYPKHVVHTDGGMFKETWEIPNLGLHREDGPAAILPDGTKIWKVLGAHHREDGPAIEGKHRREYFIRGQRHRDGGPAVEHFGENPREEWFWQGFRHREDGPAFTYDGTIQWYLFGHLHREDGPAHTDSFRQEWRIYGRRHRVGAPAVICQDGYEEWWQHGLLHREDGPAIIRSDGDKEWWYRGGRISEEIFMKVSKREVASTAPTMGQLLVAKAGMDALLGTLGHLLGVRDEIWQHPILQVLLRAGLPVLIHSQSRDESWRSWMRTCLEVALKEGGLDFMSWVRSSLERDEVRAAVEAFAEGKK